MTCSGTLFRPITQKRRSLVLDGGCFGLLLARIAGFSCGKSVDVDLFQVENRGWDVLHVLQQGKMKGRAVLGGRSGEVYDGDDGTGIPPEGIPDPSIQARTGLRLPSGGVDPVNYVQNGGNYVHGFPGRRFPADWGKSGGFPRGFLYNNGRFPGAKVGSGRRIVGQNEPAVGFWDHARRGGLSLKRGFPPQPRGLPPGFTFGLIGISGQLSINQ